MPASYFYSTGKSHPIGPVSIEQLVELEEKGVVRLDTLVASPGDPAWRPWAELRPPPVASDEWHSAGGVAPAEASPPRQGTPQDSEGVRHNSAVTIAGGEWKPPTPPAADSGPFIDPDESSKTESPWQPPCPPLSFGDPPAEPGSARTREAPPCPSGQEPCLQTPITCDAPQKKPAASGPETRDSAFASENGNAKRQEPISRWEPPPPPTQTDTTTTEADDASLVEGPWRPPLPPSAPENSSPDPTRAQVAMIPDPPPTAPQQSQHSPSAPEVPKPEIVSDEIETHNNASAPQTAVGDRSETRLQSGIPASDRSADMQTGPSQAVLQNAPTVSTDGVGPPSVVAPPSAGEASLGAHKPPPKFHGRIPDVDESKPETRTVITTQPAATTRQRRRTAAIVIGALVIVGGIGWLVATRGLWKTSAEKTEEDPSSIASQRPSAGMAERFRSNGSRTNKRGPEQEQLTNLDGNRSPEFVETISRIDVDGLELSAAAQKAVRDAIRTEFGRIPAPDRPIAILARCYLGHPYEVHLVSFADAAVDHFKIGRPLHLSVKRARQLARHSAYAFIEVYERQLRAVARDGAVTTLQM